MLNKHRLCYIYATFKQKKDTCTKCPQTIRWVYSLLFCLFEKYLWSKKLKLRAQFRIFYATTYESLHFLFSSLKIFILTVNIGHFVLFIDNCSVQWANYFLFDERLNKYICHWRCICLNNIWIVAFQLKRRFFFLYRFIK